MLQEYIMIEVGKIYYPKSLSQELDFDLKNRLNQQIDKHFGLKLVKFISSEDQNNYILIIKAHNEIKNRMVEKGILIKEQKIIYIFDCKNSLKQDKHSNPIEKEYIDDEYKCKFIFKDGLFIDNWLLPNEYDSIQIDNFPDNELDFFQHFKLNHQVVISIKKENHSIFVKFLNSIKAQEFFNYIQGKHLVFDKQNRIIVQPIITENLHINKSQFVVQVKYKSNIQQKDHTPVIASYIDRYAKNEYKIQMGQDTSSKIERVCYLVFDKKDRADFIKETQFLTNKYIYIKIQGFMVLFFMLQNKFYLTSILIIKNICFKISLGFIYRILVKIYYFLRSLEFDFYFQKQQIYFLQKRLNEQELQDIQFLSMSIQELKQGKITLPYQVYLFYESLLKFMNQTEYKILLPFDKTYQDDEVTTGLITVVKKNVCKEIISLFEQPKSQKNVNILIQAKTDKQVFKGLYEIQTLIKPKHIYQLSDTYQYNIMTEKDGREKLKELSLISKIFLFNNYNLNRIEFYTRQTQKDSKQLIKTRLQNLEDFIYNYQIKMQYPVSEKDSSAIINYLKSKKYDVSQIQNKIQTYIKYSKIKEENSHIIENFVKPLHDNMQDCQICYDTQELFTLSNCKCKTICKTCLVTHIKDKVMSSITDYQLKIKCPSCDKEPISMKDMNVIFDQINLQDIFKIRFKSGIDSLALNGQKVFKGCEFPDCKGIFKVPTKLEQGQKQNWECPMCQHEYCIKHILSKKFDLPFHEVHSDNVTCEAKIKDIGVNDLVDLGLVKQCPNCKTKYSHEDGCNHLECKECKCHFCALCDFYEMTKKNIYQHLDQEHQGAFHFKPKNIDKVDEQTKQLIEKKVQKKINKINNKDEEEDSDVEQDMFIKLKLQNNQYLYFDDKYIQDALFSDEGQSLYMSHQLFNHDKIIS